MKYRIKKARGHYRVTRSMQGNIWCYTIMAQGTTIPRITYEPVQVFASLFTPHPSHVPTFNRRCAE